MKSKALSFPSIVRPVRSFSRVTEASEAGSGALTSPINEAKSAMTHRTGTVLYTPATTSFTLSTVRAAGPIPHWDEFKAAEKRVRTG